MPSRWLKSRLLQFSAVIALGIGILVFIQLLESRSTTWKQARTANSNLLFTVGHVLERTLEAADRSLRHSVVVMETAAGYGWTNSNATLTVPHDTLLFAAVSENGFGQQLVLDNRGYALASSGSLPTDQWFFGDQPYFTVHRDHADIGFSSVRPLFQPRKIALLCP